MRPPTTARARRYAPLGHCMYCLARGVALSEEHLIPKSLGGRLTLRDAVCEPCRVRTGRYEQATLDRDFAIPKTLLALKRRRARQSGPRRLPPIPHGVCGSDAPDRPADARAAPAPVLQASNYPRSFALPTFGPAGLSVGVRHGDRPGRIAFVACRLPVGEIRGEIAAPPPTLADPAAFGRSLAKWAYGWAVAERALADWDTSAIRHLLLGARHDVFDFVGAPTPAPSVDPRLLHDLSAHVVDGRMTVRLALLGAAGMAPYEIVIATRDGG